MAKYLGLIGIIIEEHSGSVGRVLYVGLKDHWFETHLRDCIVSLSKTLYPLLGTVLTQEDRKMS